MKFVPTRRTDYAIRALLFLATREGGRSKASEIAEAMEIPQGFLHRVLQDLQRAGLVSSRPSRTGGYALTRVPKDITVLEIVESLEGPLVSGECVLRGGPCHWEEECAVHPVWSAAGQAFAAELERSTLAAIAEADRALAGRTLPIGSGRG